MEKIETYVQKTKKRKVTVLGKKIIKDKSMS
jgi:hypothetical protein